MKKIALKKKVPITGSTVKPLHIKLEAGVEMETAEGEGKDATTITDEDGNEYKPPATPAPVAPDEPYYPPATSSVPSTETTPPAETTPSSES